MNININSVNYSANVGQNNVNLTQNQTGQTQVIVPANMSASEAGTALLRYLNEGDTFKGEIINITPNQITISLSDSVTVNAFLADSLSYNIGDVASFTVKSNDGKQIVLKPGMNESPTNLINDQTIQNALNNAGLAITKENAALVHNLMRYELPINAETINNYARLLGQAGNATPEDVIILTQMKIPVTEENVNALHDYYNYNEGITGKAETLTDNFLGIIQNLPESVSQATVSMLNNFVNAFSDTISKSENISEKISPESRDVLAGIIENDNPEAIETANVIREGNLTSKNFLSTIIKEFNEGKITPEAFKKIVDSNEFKQVVENFVRQEMFIAPEDINKQNIKKLFSKIINDTQNLTEKFSGIKLADNMLNTNEQIRQNVDFLNQANQFMNFIQIPLKMTGQNTHGDLYVYKNGKNDLSEKEELKALLHLDMDNLGPMDIFVCLKNQNVTTNFKVASDKILDYIEEHIDELNIRLKALGYNVTTNITSEKSDYSFKKKVIDDRIPPVEIKRFSFDVRA